MKAVLRRLGIVLIGGALVIVAVLAFYPAPSLTLAHALTLLRVFFLLVLAGVAVLIGSGFIRDEPEREEDGW